MDEDPHVDRLSGARLVRAGSPAAAKRPARTTLDAPIRAPSVLGLTGVGRVGIGADRARRRGAAERANTRCERGRPELLWCTRPGRRREAAAKDCTARARS